MKAEIFLSIRTVVISYRLVHVLLINRYYNILLAKNVDLGCPLANALVTLLDAVEHEHSVSPVIKITHFRLFNFL